MLRLAGGPADVLVEDGFGFLEMLGLAEQVDGVTARHARRTSVCRTALEHIGLALAGRALSRAGPSVRPTLVRQLSGPYGFDRAPAFLYFVEPAKT